MKFVRISVAGMTDEDPSLQCVAETITIEIPDKLTLREAITHIVHHGAAELMEHAAYDAIIALGDWPHK